MFSSKILNLDHTKILSTFLGRRNDMSRPPWHHRPHSRCHFCLYSYHVLSIQAAWYIAHRNLPPYNIKKAYWYIFSTLSMIIFVISLISKSLIFRWPLPSHFTITFAWSLTYPMLTTGWVTYWNSTWIWTVLRDLIFPSFCTSCFSRYATNISLLRLSKN